MSVLLSLRDMSPRNQVVNATNIINQTTTPTVHDQPSCGQCFDIWTASEIATATMVVITIKNRTEKRIALAHGLSGFVTHTLRLAESGCLGNDSHNRFGIAGPHQ